MIVAYGNHLIRHTAHPENYPEIDCDSESFFMTCVACNCKLRLQFVEYEQSDCLFDILGMDTPCVSCTDYIDPETGVEK
jgi:hypothetical protein